MLFSEEEINLIISRYPQMGGISFNWAKIDIGWCEMHIEKRPFYCNRGRYGFIPEVKPESRFDYTIDGADGFPRYFFSLERALDELDDWLKIRNEQAAERPIRTSPNKKH